MGQDKAALRLEGETLVARAAGRLAGACSEVLIAGADRHSVHGFESVPDGAGLGPVAGILGAHNVRPSEALIVLACDLPQVPTTLLLELRRNRESDWVVPRWRSRVEPLCSLYRPAALRVLVERVANERYALHELLSEPRVTVGFIEGAQLEGHGRPPDMFLNVNTVAEWRALDPRRSPN